MGPINFRLWLRRVLGWDVLLPAIIGILPHIIELLVPNNRGVIELAAITAPVAVFFLRIRAGRRQILMNHCSAAVRRCQFVVFILAIIPLALLDCVLILTNVMPAGAFNDQDRFVFAVIYTLYFGLMAVAMYPGRMPASHSTE